MDFCFLRFKDTLAQSLNLGDGADVSIFHNNQQIHFLPNKSYSFITNIKNGFALNSLTKVSIIDFCENELADVTEHFIFSQFQDDNGKYQQKIEFVNLETDFYKTPLLFKINSLTSDVVFYSTPFVLTNYENNKVTQFDFKNYNNLDGTCYEVADIMQSISLKCSFDKVNYESKSTEYVTLNGKKVSSRLIKTPIKEYYIDYCTNFIYERLNYIFSHDVVYIDGVRVTNKQTIENPDRYEKSANIGKIAFSVPVDYTDTYTRSFQIWQPLTVTALNVPDNSSFDVMPSNDFTVTFNKTISITDNSIQCHLYQNNVLVESVTPTVTGNTLNITFTYVFDVAEYYILIDTNKISSTFESWGSFINPNDWNFTIKQADYNNNDYNNNDYLS